MPQIDGLTINNDVLLLLFIHVFRNETFAAKCFERIDYTYFTQYEEFPFQLIWTTALDYYSKYGQLPNKQILSALISSRLEQEHLDEKTIIEVNDSLEKIFKYIFDRSRYPDSDLDYKIAYDFAELLRARRYAVNFEQELRTINGNLSGFRALVQNISKEYLEKTISPGVSNLTSVVSNDLSVLSETSNYKHIGVPFLDEMMKGALDSEVYVILGPTGGGKSLLGQQICVSNSLYSITPKGLNVFFSYELRQVDLQKRAICQAAKIPPSRLEELILGAPPSTVMLDYERKLFSGGTFLSEKERLESAISLLNQRTRFLDFSGFPYNGISYGSGGLNEIVDALKTLEDETSLPINFVVIDWAEICLRRWLETNNVDVSRFLVTEMSNFVRDSYTKIAAKFNCTVWIIHQLAGNVLEKSISRSLHHSNAAWCKSFANAAWYAFVIGREVLVNETGARVCKFVCSKPRRSELPPDRILAKSPFLTFIDVTNDYDCVGDEFFYKG